MSKVAAPQVFIHPGFGKTGTTTLQNHLFGVHSEICSIGRPYTDVNLQLREALGKIEGVTYNDHLTASLIRDALRQGGSAKASCIVLSDETLINNAYTRVHIAQRLKRHFPDAQVFFTIRNQITALQSYYSNHGRILKDVPRPFHGRHVSLDNWLKFAYEHWEVSFLGLLDYHSSIGIYEDIFEIENVHVLLFEDFKHDQQRFLSHLTPPLNIDADEAHGLLSGKHDNPRHTTRQVSYTRFRKRLLADYAVSRGLPFRRVFHNVFRTFLHNGNRIYVELPDHWKQTLVDFYKSGNTRLARRHRLPLEEYGYPFEPQPEAALVRPRLLNEPYRDGSSDRNRPIIPSSFPQ